MTRPAADWFANDESFGCFYIGNGSLAIDFSEFSTPVGCLLIEQTTNGGGKWTPLPLTKVGRGMATSALSSGPARFQGHVWDETNAMGVRVRNNGLLDMQPVEITMHFAGTIARHILRGASNYVIQETPDFRDLTR